jgi:hypothetical protein
VRIEVIPGAAETIRKAREEAAARAFLSWHTLSCVCPECLTMDRRAELIQRPVLVLFTSLEQMLDSPIV